MKRSLAYFISAVFLLAPVALETMGQQPPAQEAPAFDRQVNLVYTVNNLGYNDTCG